MTGVPLAYIDATGCHVPPFSDVLAWFQSQYQGVYGPDVQIDGDTQDGQWIGIQAAAVNDANNNTLAAYNSFRPSGAQGTGLSSVVKVNGIGRNVPSFSTCDVDIVGQTGTELINGAVGGADSSVKWLLPALVTIPFSGEITVTVTCNTAGAHPAPIGTLVNRLTPTRGWQSVTNSAPAALGQPVETDPELYARQQESTMIPSIGIIDGIDGALRSLPNVVNVRVYENDDDIVNTDGIPGHCLSVVVEGGDDTAIGNVLAAKKFSAGTYGTTAVVVTSLAGVPRTIRFFRPVKPPITVVINLTALAGYTTDVENQISIAVSAWVNKLGIGVGQTRKIIYSRIYGPALLIGTPAEGTFEINSIALARDGAAPTVSDLNFLFYEEPYCDPTFVTVYPS